MREEIEEFHDGRCCGIVRNHPRHVKDTGTFSFHEYESIVGRDDSVNDLVVNHSNHMLAQRQDVRDELRSMVRDLELACIPHRNTYQL